MVNPQERLDRMRQAFHAEVLYTVRFVLVNICGAALLWGILFIAQAVRGIFGEALIFADLAISMAWLIALGWHIVEHIDQMRRERL